MAEQSTLGKFFKRADGTSPAAPMKQQSLKAAFKKGNSSNKDDSSNTKPKSQSPPPPASSSSTPLKSQSSSSSKNDDQQVKSKSDEMDVDQDQVKKHAEIKHVQSKDKGKENASKKRVKEDEKVSKEDGIDVDGGEDQDDENEVVAPSRKRARTSKPKSNVVDSDDDEDEDVDEKASSSPVKSSSKSTPNTSTASKSSSSSKDSSLTKSKTKTKARSKSPERKKVGNDKARESKVKEAKKVEVKKKSKKVQEDEDDEDEKEEGSDVEKEKDEDEDEDEEDEEEEMSGDEEEAADNIAAIFLKGYKDTTSTSKKKKTTKDVVETDFEVEDWKDGASVPYSALAKAFSAIEDTTKRILIMQILTKLLIKVIEKSPHELTRVIYLCVNKIAPDYAGIELGIGETLLIKAIAQASGRSAANVKKDFNVAGDLGKVALNSRKGQAQMFKPAPHTVPKIFSALTSIAKESGSGSQGKKVDIITKLLGACQGQESKFLIRSLEGKMKIGLAVSSVTTSLAHAAVIYENLMKPKKEKIADPEELKEAMENGTMIVKQIFSEVPNFEMVCEALLKVGINGLRDACRLTPGLPVKPMLAKPTKAITEILDRFEGKSFTCEYKYDGERSQVHFYPNIPSSNSNASSSSSSKNASPSKNKNTSPTEKAPTSSTEDSKVSIGVFSRNSENMLNKYPDLVVQVPHAVKEGVTSFVLDAEVVAWQKGTTTVVDGKEVVEEARLLPFQELSKRKRKDVKVEDIKVKAKLYAFDLLYLNGESLLHLPLSVRREKLRASFNIVPDEFEFATWQDCTTVDEIQTMLDASVKSGCEGLMVKMLEGPESFYEPSRRSMNWLKVKKDYLAGVGDSLDLVVIGAYLGKGKRTNVYGAFLLACYDPDTETYQLICKIGTGFTEANLEEFHTLLKPHEIPAKKRYYDVGSVPPPDVYFDAKVVWEVMTADLSLSPIYTAAKGLVHESKGISLRFPRFIRVRDDKEAEDATGPEQIAEFYSNQAVMMNSSKGKKSSSDDY